MLNKYYIWDCDERLWVETDSTATLNLEDALGFDTETGAEFFIDTRLKKGLYYIMKLSKSV
jgi:hypothetical protein